MAKEFCTVTWDENNGVAVHGDDEVTPSSPRTTLNDLGQNGWEVCGFTSTLTSTTVGIPVSQAFALLTRDVA